MDIASLPNDPAALKELLVDKASYIAQLEEQVRLLKAILHLAKSERQAKPTAKESKRKGGPTFTAVRLRAMRVCRLSRDGL